MTLANVECFDDLVRRINLERVAHPQRPLRAADLCRRWDLDELTAVAVLERLAKGNGGETTEQEGDAWINARRANQTTRRGTRLSIIASLPIDVAAQPDETTCGPTCLHAVYRFLGDDVRLSQVVSEITPLPGGGTLAVSLACHALRRGYAATIYTYNLRLFDPSWFATATPSFLADRLDAQRRAKPDDPKLVLATDAYVEFLSLGGIVRYEDLTPTLIENHLRQRIPVLAGLSATYLYRCAREFQDDYDDVRGDPVGHFVIVRGFDPDVRQVEIADPLHDNPRFDTPSYRVSVARFVGAVLLGIVTYDANLLVITPGPDQKDAR